MRLPAPRLAKLLVVAPLALCGCYADHDHYDDCGYGPNQCGYPPPPTCDPGVTPATVDTGSYLDLDPGRAGVTAEYFGDGAWRFAMACDTPLSGAVCNYRMTVSPLDGEIVSFAPEDLERDDILAWQGRRDVGDGLIVDTLTDYDLDAFTLEATPGSTLEVNLSLDGYCGSRFLFWLENGELPEASTDTVDLTPSTP